MKKGRVFRSASLTEGTVKGGKFVKRVQNKKGNATRRKKKRYIDGLYLWPGEKVSLDQRIQYPLGRLPKRKEVKTHVMGQERS